MYSIYLLCFLCISGGLARFSDTNDFNQLLLNADIGDNLIDVDESTKPSCPPHFTGRIAFEWDCGQYVECSSGRASVQNCESGTLFNRRTRRCDHPSKVKCRSNRFELVRKRRFAPPSVAAARGQRHQEVQCPRGASGLFAHPHNCAKFLNCNHGQTFVQDCGPGTVFNDLIKVCDWPHNVECDARGPGAFVDNELQPEKIQVESPYVYPMDVRGAFDQQPAPSTQTRSHRKYVGPVAGGRINAHGTQNPYNPNPFIPSSNQFPYQQYPSIPLAPQPIVEVDLPAVPVFDESVLMAMLPPPIPAGVDLNALDDAGYSPSPYAGGNAHSHRRADGGSAARPHSNGNGVAAGTSANGDQSSRGNVPALENRNNVQNQYPQLNYLSRRVVNEFDRVLGEAQSTTAPTPTTSTTTGRPTATPPANRVRMVYPHGFEGVGARCAESGFDMHPHPFDCTKYMTCERGHMRMHSCNAGFMFNPALKVCDYTRNVAKCQATPSAGAAATTPRTINDEINEIHDGYRREKTLDAAKPANRSSGWVPPPPRPSTELLPPPMPAGLLPPTATTPQNFGQPPPQKAYFIPDMSVLPLSTDARPKYPDEATQSNKKFNKSPAQHTDTVAPDSMADLDKQIEGIKTRIATEENITVAANKPLEHLPRGKDHVMPIYQRPSRMFGADAPTRPPPTTTTTTPKPVEYEPFAIPPNEAEQETDYMPIGEALKLLLQPYLQRGNATKAPASNETSAAHMNNIENRLADLMDNGAGVRIAHKSLEQDSLAEAEFNDNSIAVKATAPAPKQRLPDDVEELTEPNGGYSTTPPSSRTFGHRQHQHHQYNHNHRLTHTHDPSALTPSNLHARVSDDVETIETNSDPDRITFPGPSNNHPHPNPSSSPNHAAPNKHANHPGSHLNRGPNYRSNAAPENLDQIRANRDKEAALAEEGLLCQFDCRNGKCIAFSQLCDGKNDCGNRYDELSCPHINYQARLSANNGKKHMGRVEVRAFGKWGYVCDNHFTMTEANVLCRELGFNMGAAEVKSNSYYPPNAKMLAEKSMFMMDNVRCNGNETALKDCDFDGWGISECSAEEVVGVVCKTTIMQCPPNHWLCQESEECIPWNFMCDNIKDCTDGTDESDMHCKAKIEYRLMGGSELEGRVEVKYRGMWGTVCDDDFGEQEASVLCKSLGFHGAATVVEGKFGPGTGPIWLDQVNCMGNESAIDKCMHFEWSETNCNHTEDVSVRCARGSDGKSGKYIAGGMEFQRLTNRETHDYSRALDVTDENAPDFSNSCGEVKVTGDDDSDDGFERFRVIGGSRARRGHHPWQATIRTRTKFGSMHWCGAVILSEKHILTAAHCLVGFPTGAYVVRVGDHHSDVYEKSEVESFIERWSIHEDFRKDQRMNNDIALIQLKQPVQFTKYIQPICLPTRETVYEAGRNCSISGWGTIQYGKSTPSYDLKAAHVPLIAQEICRRQEFYGDEIMDTMFCAGFLNRTGVDACDGDSGGPLVCADDLGVHSLYGVISWGQRCGDATKPGVYVKVTEYLDWIKEKMALLN